MFKPTIILWTECAEQCGFALTYEFKSIEQAQAFKLPRHAHGMGWHGERGNSQDERAIADALQAAIIKDLELRRK